MNYENIPLNMSMKEYFEMHKQNKYMSLVADLYIDLYIKTEVIE